MDDSQQKLHRVDRLVEIRHSYVTAAEGRVRDAEFEVRACELAVEEKDRQILQAGEEIAYLKRFTGETIQQRERYIFGLHVRARQAREVLDKARKALDARRLEWREMMRHLKVMEKVRERRLQEWRQSVDVAEQKDADELTTSRYARNLISHSTGEPGETGSIG